MSEAERSRAFRQLWEGGVFIRRLDPRTDLLYGSSPLKRVFTLSHELIACEYRRVHGESIDNGEQLEAEADAIMLSIEETIHRHGGVVQWNHDRNEGVSKYRMTFRGFQKNFGSDDSVAALTPQ